MDLTMTRRMKKIVSSWFALVEIHQNTAMVQAIVMAVIFVVAWMG